MENKHGSSKADRKLVEKNRRDQMKSLCSELISLIPSHKPKEAASLADQLDEATEYIKHLGEEMEKMKMRKQKLMGSLNRMANGMDGIKRPVIEIHSVGSSLEVILIGGMDSKSMFYKIIRVLHEESAEVVNACFSVINDSIIHSIHSVVEDSMVPQGVARITMRLNQLIHVSVHEVESCGNTLDFSLTSLSSNSVSQLVLRRINKTRSLWGKSLSNVSVSGPCSNSDIEPKVAEENFHLHCFPQHIISLLTELHMPSSSNSGEEEFAVNVC